MKLFDMKTAAGLAGSIVGVTFFINGCYFIDSLGKPLILTGVLLTLGCVAYLVFHTHNLLNSTVTPEVNEPSYV